VDGSSWQSISRLGWHPLRLRGFSRRERITHSFIRKLLKTPAACFSALIGQHHMLRTK
jgi:hypothetical protein